MSETKEILVVHCDCNGRSNHHNSNSRSLSRNPNSRSVQRHSEDCTASKIAAGIGGFAIGVGVVFLLAALLGDD